MRIVCDDLWLCPDCTILAVNGDPPEDDELAAACTAGLEALGPHLVPNDGGQWDDGHDEFSAYPCDACNGLPGERYRFAILGE